MRKTIASITQNADSVTSISTAHRVGTLVAVIVPFVGLLIAVYGFGGWGFSRIELAILVVMYTAAGLGITIGFRRLFTHRSFETIRPVKLLLALLGSMAVEGPVLVEWRRSRRQMGNVGSGLARMEGWSIATIQRNALTRLTSWEACDEVPRANGV